MNSNTVPAILFITAATVGLIFPTHTIEAPYLHTIPLLLLISIAIYFHKRSKHLLGPSLFFILVYITKTLPFFTLGLMLVIPIIVYFLMAQFVKPLKDEKLIPPVGEVNKISAIIGLVVVVVSSASLLLWYGLFNPDIAVFAEYFPKVELYKLMIGGLVFSVVNAIVEEVIYRGILFGGLLHLFDNVRTVIIIQAVIFGSIHYWGVPNGILGVVMAFIYGLFLGAIRNHAKGLLMPIVIHIFADITIFLILLNIIGRI